MLATNQHEVSYVDDGADALAGNKHWVLSIDGIGKGNQSPDEAHIQKRHRHLALGGPFRGNPLNHPTAEEKSLPQESYGDPNGFSRRHDRTESVTEFQSA